MNNLGFAATYHHAQRTTDDNHEKFKNQALKAQPTKLRPRIHTDKLPPASNITLESIRPFLKDSLIMQSDDIFATAPSIISLQEERATVGKGDVIYACGITNLVEPIYTIYRRNHFYIHPITKECLGYEADVVGTAAIKIIDKISELQILTASEGVTKCNKLLPNYIRPPFADFTVRDAVTPNVGYILEVKEAQDYLGRNNVVVISLGMRDGLQEGDVLEIHQTSSGWSFCSSCPVMLNDKTIGKALVYRIFDKLSLALVTESNQGVQVLDKVRSP